MDKKLTIERLFMEAVAMLLKCNPAYDKNMYLEVFQQLFFADKKGVEIADELDIQYWKVAEYRSKACGAFTKGVKHVTREIEQKKMLEKHCALLEEEKVALLQRVKDVEAENAEFRRELKLLPSEIFKLEISEVHTLKISDLDMLSQPTRDRLKAGDILTIGMLITYTRKQLLRLRNFGPKCLGEVEEMLKKFDLKLKID